MSIELIITGGTIDKTYDKLTGKLLLNKSQIFQMLKQSNCYAKLAIETIFLKDSLDIDQSERNLIKTHCVNTSYKNIVITHGTDTMVQTARLLANCKLNKTIVITGAMIPFSIKNSDALFNLGVAIGAVQTLKPNVYIAMGGCLFSPDKVQKNYQNGRFEI